MGKGRYSFGKEHKLCNRKQIESLFTEGESVFAYPLRCNFRLAKQMPGRKEAPVQVMVSVSKRNHKRAVARNLLKRRIREAYRLNRHLWDAEAQRAETEGMKLTVGFIYTQKDILNYSDIEHGIRKAIQSVRRKLASANAAEDHSVPVRPSH